MITENSSVILLSDSICARGSNSRNNPAFLMMDAVNVVVHNLAAEGLPVGRVPGFEFVPVAMSDQKTAVNFLCGLYDSVECLIVFGGANDWIYGDVNTVRNYGQGLREIIAFARQIGVSNVVAVSPLGILSGEVNLNSSVDMADIRTECAATVMEMDAAYSNVFYIDGLALMPVIPANYEVDELHPNDTGRSIWVGNLISHLQLLDIFPASYP